MFSIIIHFFFFFLFFYISTHFIIHYFFFFVVSIKTLKIHFFLISFFHYYYYTLLLIITFSYYFYFKHSYFSITNDTYVWMDKRPICSPPLNCHFLQHFIKGSFESRQFFVSILLSLLFGLTKIFFYDWSNKYFFSQNSKFVFHQWWFKVSSFLTTLVSHLLATKEIWLRRRQIVMKVCLPGGPFLCVGALISIHNFMCTYRFKLFLMHHFFVCIEKLKESKLFLIFYSQFFLRMNFFSRWFSLCIWFCKFFF